MFRVDWLQSALNELADLWTQADSDQRQVITEACHAIEQRLARDPEQESESRPAGRRITFAPPLAATYRIEEDERTVTVVHVRMFRHRRR